MNQVTKKGLRRRKSQEVVPLRVKGLENFKLIQYTVQLLGVEGKGLMLLLVLVKAWPQNKEKV